MVAGAAAAGEVCRAGGAGADLVVLDAQDDELFDRGRVNVAGDDRDDHRVGGDGPGRAAVQPGAAVPGAD
jgi:hypothetical protein